MDTVSRSIFVSTTQRDETRFPKAYKFDIELPMVLKKVYALSLIHI